MTQIIIIEKENFKEDSIDDMNNLYKKCKFKKQEDFLELMTWNFKKFTFKMLVIKINGKLIKKEQYESAKIVDGDNVAVIHLISGG